MMQLLNILRKLPNEYSFKMYTSTLAIIFNGKYDEFDTPFFVAAYQYEDKILLSDKGYIGYRFVDGNTDQFQALLNNRNEENGYGTYPGTITKNVKNINDITSMFSYLNDTLSFFIQEGFEFSDRKKIFFDVAFATNEVLPYMGNHGIRVFFNEDNDTYKLIVAKYKKTSAPFTEVEHEIGSIEKTENGFIYTENGVEISEEEYQELHPTFRRAKLMCFDPKKITSDNLWNFVNCMESIYHLL